MRRLAAYHAAKTGTIESGKWVGKWADLIAVEKNPLDDIHVLQDVKFVMKAAGTKSDSRDLRVRFPLALRCYHKEDCSSCRRADCLHFRNR